MCAILIIAGALFFYWPKTEAEKGALSENFKLKEESVSFENVSESDSMEVQAPAELVPKNETTTLISEQSKESRFYERSEQVLIFVGDIMLSRNIGSLMLKKSDWKFPFLKIADFLKEADLLIGNLEGPISSGGVRSGSIYSFRADPRAVDGLLYAGFDVLSVANNHIWDYGRAACEDTLDILEDSGIGVIGGGRNYEEAHAPLIKEINEIKIAFLGYTNLLSRNLTTEGAKPAIAYLEKERMVLDIGKAKEAADFVAVFLHWGDEYQTRHNKQQEELAHAAVGAGAKLVVGHHPHVVQDTEEYNGGYIAYSLGNFVFDQNFSEGTRKGMVLKVVLRGKEISRVEPITIRFNLQFQPYIP